MNQTVVEDNVLHHMRHDRNESQKGLELRETSTHMGRRPKKSVNSLTYRDQETVDPLCHVIYLSSVLRKSIIQQERQASHLLIQARLGSLFSHNN